MHPVPSAPSKRVGLIDEVRGFAIVCMVFYHLGYDLVAIFGVDWQWMFSPAMNIIRDVFAGGFIFISGVACLYSRNNLKRGAICFALGLVMTLFTWIAMPDQLILFGILHFLGVCMMLFALIHKLLEKVSPVIGTVVCAIAFILTYNLALGYLFVPFVGRVMLPASLYTHPLLSPLGFLADGFFSSDYFPLLPWIFVFFAGALLGRYLKDGRAPKWVYRTHLKPLAFIGRHTIIVYLLHQPVVYGLLWVFFNLFIH